MNFEEFLGMLIFGLPIMLYVVMLPVWVFYELIIRRVKRL